jgi:hypothetical protein
MGAVEKALEVGMTYMTDNSPATISVTIQKVIGERRYEHTAGDAAEAMYGPDAVVKSVHALVTQSV